MRVVTATEAAKNFGARLGSQSMCQEDRAVAH